MMIETKSKDKDSWLDEKATGPLVGVFMAVNLALDAAARGIDKGPRVLGEFVITLRSAADQLVPFLRCDVTGLGTTLDERGCNCVSCRAARGARAIV